MRRVPSGLLPLGKYLAYSAATADLLLLKTRYSSKTDIVAKRNTVKLIVERHFAQGVAVTSPMALRRSRIFKVRCLGILWVRVACCLQIFMCLLALGVRSQCPSARLVLQQESRGEGCLYRLVEAVFSNTYGGGKSQEGVSQWSGTRAKRTQFFKTAVKNGRGSPMQ